MPEGHRWGDRRNAAKQPDIGCRIDKGLPGNPGRWAHNNPPEAEAEAEADVEPG